MIRKIKNSTYIRKTLINEHFGKGNTDFFMKRILYFSPNYYCLPKSLFYNGIYFIRVFLFLDWGQSSRGPSMVVIYFEPFLINS